MLTALVVGIPLAVTSAVNFITPFAQDLFRDEPEAAGFKMSEDEKELIRSNTIKTDRMGWLSAMKEEEINSLIGFRRADDALLNYQMAERSYVETTPPNVVGVPLLYVGAGLITTYFIIKRYY